MTAHWARWGREHGIVAVVGVIAAAPVIVAVIRALGHHWVPLADNGVIALRSWDVFTDRSPLVGQFSIATAVSVGKVYSPGPLLYWLLAIPMRLFGLDAVPVTIGLVNVASIMGAVALARRRAGTLFMVATAVALALMCRSLPPAILYTPINETVPLLPCTLLVFLAWSLACGEYRLLPLTAVVASFVAETQLAFVLPVVGMLAVGIVGLVRNRAPLRWVLASLLLGVVCWSAPLADELVHNPGNLTLLRRTLTADRATLGVHTGWHAVVQAFGVPPWWLQPAVGDAERFTDVAVSPSHASIVGFLAVLAGLLAVAVLRWRRGTVLSGAVLALVLVGALGAVAAATPAERVITIGFTMQWGSPAGMFAWLALGLGTATALPALRRLVPQRVAAQGLPRSAPAAAALLIPSVFAIWAALPARPDPERWINTPTRQVLAHVRSAVDPGETVFVQPGGGELGYQSYPVLVYTLRREGVHPLVAPASVETMGESYGVTGRRYDRSLTLSDDGAPAPPGYRVIARVPLGDAPVPAGRRVVTVMLGPGGEGPRR